MIKTNMLYNQQYAFQRVSTTKSSGTHSRNIKGPFSLMNGQIEVFILNGSYVAIGNKANEPLDINEWC